MLFNAKILSSNILSVPCGSHLPDSSRLHPWPIFFASSYRPHPDLPQSPLVCGLSISSLSCHSLRIVSNNPHTLINHTRRSRCFVRFLLLSAEDRHAVDVHNRLSARSSLVHKTSEDLLEQDSDGYISPTTFNTQSLLYFIYLSSQIIRCGSRVWLALQSMRQLQFESFKESSTERASARFSEPASKAPVWRTRRPFPATTFGITACVQPSPQRPTHFLQSVSSRLGHLSSVSPSSFLRF